MAHIGDPIIRISFKPHHGFELAVFIYDAAPAVQRAMSGKAIAFRRIWCGAPDRLIYSREAVQENEGWAAVGKRQSVLKGTPVQFGACDSQKRGIHTTSAKYKYLSGKRLQNNARQGKARCAIHCEGAIHKTVPRLTLYMKCPAPLGGPPVDRWG